MDHSISASRHSSICLLGYFLDPGLVFGTALGGRIANVDERPPQCSCATLLSPELCGIQLVGHPMALSEMQQQGLVSITTAFTYDSGNFAAQVAASAEVVGVNTLDGWLVRLLASPPYLKYKFLQSH